MFALIPFMENFSYFTDYVFFLHTEETIKNCDVALLRFSMVNSSKHEVD